MITMVEETKKLISYIKKLTGKYELRESEIINLLSIKNDYLTPDEVKEFLRIALSKGYLKFENGFYKIMISTEDFEPDLNFFPDIDKIRMENEDVDIFTEALSRIVSKTGMQKNVIVKEINMMKELNPFLYPDVAILYIAKKNGVNVDDLIEKSKKIIIS